MKIRPIRYGLRRILRSLGYDIRRLASSSNSVVGEDPLDDMATFVRGSRPTIFDVGANVGQSVERFRSRFTDCEVHSFEPSPTTFEKLTNNVSQLPGVHAWNCAVGATQGQMEFFENSIPEMSSLLPLSEYGWGEVEKKTAVEVNTVDDFCETHGIKKIDILKSDTQGYDFEVFKGAEEMMAAGKISLIYFEIIFSEMYENLPSFGEVFQYLEDQDFRLVSLYETFYQNRLASWSDGLFVHDSMVAARK